MSQAGGRHLTFTFTPPQFRCLMTKWSRRPNTEAGEIMPQRTLVTSATGATGGYVVERLLERGHAVRNGLFRRALTAT